MSHSGPWLFADGTWLCYVYAGYAVWLWIIGAFRSIRRVNDEHYFPRVFVLSAARHEQNEIYWRVRRDAGEMND